MGLILTQSDREGPICSEFRKCRFTADRLVGKCQVDVRGADSVRVGREVGDRDPPATAEVVHRACRHDGGIEEPRDVRNVCAANLHGSQIDPSRLERHLVEDRLGQRSA